MTKVVAVSPALRGAVWRERAAGTRQADIAKRAGLDPTVVSKLLCGLVQVRPGDPRVLQLARAVNVPANEAFVLTRHRDDR